MAKIVIALGGNALGNNVIEQKSAINQVVPVLIDLISDGNEIVVSHGNGPQVGKINLAFTEYFERHQSEDTLPFPECNAMSEGYIGYHLQSALSNECQRRAIEKRAVTVITQVEVSKKDPAFTTPSKPIGAFYTKEEAEVISARDHYVMKEDAGRGYRRVVPSPYPQDILEKKAICQLVDAGHIVIACGGGGVPVVKEESGYEGVAAVIDKDFASARLAELIGADMLVILTTVPQVFIDFGKPTQKGLGRITPKEITEYQKLGQFSAGSMLPKVKAAVSFVEAKKGNRGIITSFDSLTDALKGVAGTVIESEGF